MKSWLSNRQLQHPLFFPLLLVVVIMVVYYPALLSGVHTVDDPGIISLYSAGPPLSQVLLPGHGYYYRPLLELSYWLDNLLWGMAPSVMHLESILLHCANSLLIFLLARRISKESAGSFPVISMTAALLFAVHPVNVEAVAWIAGRTDPLLSLFTLSACFFWLRWLDEPRWRDLTCALLLFAAALLVKETALAAGAVALLLALAWPGKATVRQRVTLAAVLSTAGLLAVLSALAFRSATSGLTSFISSAELQLGQGLRDMTIAFGFYVRKLIVPVPLNFAITEVHPINALAAVALLPALGQAYRRNRQAGLLFTCAALLVLPGIAVAVNPIAWTPFAERYLYLPSAFLVLGLSALSLSWSEKMCRPLVILLLTVSVVFAWVSLQRAELWGDKLAFVQDQVAKSPHFGTPYNELGALLFGRGEIDRAEQAFAMADRLNKRPSMRLPIKANLMGVQHARGDYSGVRQAFFYLFEDKKQAPSDFLDLLQKADSARMHTLTGKSKNALGNDLLETLDLLNLKRYDPFWLYRSGQIALNVGDERRAADFFLRSYLAAPADAHYRGAAGIYLEKLGRSL